jgi:hypothetical protein
MKVRLFVERTFNRNIKRLMKDEIEKYHMKSKQDCYKVGQQMGSMMREIIDELSKEENYDESMKNRFIEGLRSSV